MRAPRLALVAGLVVLATVVDAAYLSRLPLPGGTPSLALLVVVAMALLGGPREGAATGLAAGVLADVTPPAAALLGVGGLALGLAGAAAGTLHREGERSALVPVVAAGAAAAVASGVTVLAAPLASAADLGAGAVPAVGASVLWAVVLAPFVIPGVAALERQVAPEEWM